MMNVKFVMHPVLFAVFFLLGVSHMEAQVRISYGMSSPGFVLETLNPNKYSVIDTAYLSVTYRFHTKGAENDAAMSCEDVQSLLVGKNYTSFFSQELRNLDMLNDSLSRKSDSYATAEEGWQGYEIRQNLTKKEFIVDNRIPFTKAVYRYEEKVPSMAWTLTSETDSVLGYPCQKATLHYRGRDYIAWFTPEIPVGFGPWKFQGLPGLILKVMDTDNNFKFECIGLSQKACPIVNYAWSYTHTTKREWIKFERKMYEHAGQFVKSVGANVLIMDNSEKGYHVVPESWRAYYNPMELGE